MTPKNEFREKWVHNHDPEERRARLDELGAKFGELSENEIREHDVLAVIVAEDEEAAAWARKANDGE